MSGNHPYHLVEPSPWPAVGAASAFILVIGLTMYMHSYSYGFLTTVLGFLLILMTMFFWFRDITREAEFQGHHYHSCDPEEYNVKSRYQDIPRIKSIKFICFIRPI